MEPQGGLIAPFKMEPNSSDVLRRIFESLLAPGPYGSPPAIGSSRPNLFYAGKRDSPWRGRAPQFQQTLPIRVLREASAAGRADIPCLVITKMLMSLQVPRAWISSCIVEYDSHGVATHTRSIPK